MKIEEAIEILKHLNREYPPEQIYQAINMAITALHSMPEVGEPLSLEQLREMDGKPVWVEDKCDPELSAWGNVCGDACVVFHKQKYYGAYHIEDYEGRWLAYSYPPAHIDRSKWKPCVDCRVKCRTCVVRGKEKCARCEKYSEYVSESNFCSNCGRPLTEAAWAELERRLRE